MLSHEQAMADLESAARKVSAANLAADQPSSLILWWRFWFGRDRHA